MNSHIQMPKQILKNFQNENATIYYYDIQSKTIKMGRAKKLNTKEGYYSIEVEGFLNKEIEDTLGKLTQHIENNFVINSSCKIPPYFVEVIFNYIASLYSRSINTVKEIVETFPELRSLSEQEIHDIVAIKGKEAVIETGILDDFIPSVLYNKSAEDFVLPLCGLYAYKSTGRCLIAPFRPDMAFVLIEKNLFQTRKNEDSLKILLVQKEEETRFFNKLALNTQIKQNNGYVMSRSKLLLEDLIK